MFMLDESQLKLTFQSTVLGPVLEKLQDRVKSAQLVRCKHFLLIAAHTHATFQGNLISRSSIHYVDGRRTARSPEASKPRDWVL